MYAFFFLYEVRKKRAEEICCCEVQGLIYSVSNLVASQRFLPGIEIRHGPQFSLEASHLMTESTQKTAAHPSAHLVCLSILFYILPVSLSFHLSDSIHPKKNPQSIAWEAWVCVSRARLPTHLEIAVLPSLRALFLCVTPSSERR